MSKIENLGFYRVEDHTAVLTDASPCGLGAILIQFDEAGKHRVISFASKSLTDTERRYCQTEKEALGIVWGVERFQYYLLGKTFDIHTDCKALSFLFSQRSKPCARIERWVLRLQAFDYKVIFTSGKDNVADTLSRLSIQKAIPFDSSEEIFVREVVMHAVNSSALTWRDIAEASKADSEIQQVLNILESGENQDLPIVYRVIANELCDFQGVLIRGDRIVVPCSLREKVLLTAHEGHPGITMMKNHLRSHVWWPKMDAQVEKIVKNCRGCTLVGAPEPPEPLQRSQLPSYPWHTIALDFFGPLPEGQHLMVVIDYYSRFMEVCEMETTTAQDVIRELSIMFSRYGIPVTLKADNAPQLSADCAEFKQFCDANGIKLMNTIPYWPQSNGEVERQNRSIIKRLRIAQELGHDWRQELYKYLLTYHSSKHPTTGKSPGEIMFGRRIKNKLPCISSFQEDAGVRERDAVVKQKGKEYADQRRGAKRSILKVGDHVLAKRMRKVSKLDGDFSNEEFVICQKKGTDTLIQSKDNGKQYRRSSAHLKKIGEEQHSSVDESTNNPLHPSETGNTPIKASAPNQPLANPDKRIRIPPSKYHDYVPY
ncbi:uncharacterized protein K02A2.6-like [Sabethes cyaneus]|uniref:uncharacterized protein K02A2.6-like n=1 Tax=Sabethes cyaneus TaxID=53552 RepID=UPI00237E67D7|nr:uncharacterized protein K02A2.6-like [Sabethes cyaneus]